MVLIEDALVYSKSNKLQEQHFTTSLQLLRDNWLYAKLSKCECCLDKVAFLEHIISKNGLAVDPSKIVAIVSWESLKNVVEVRSFLELVGYYRTFVVGFSSIAAPLSKLTRKNVSFVWSKESEASFQELKWLTTAPILTLPSGSGGFVVFTNASSVGLGCVLMQNRKIVAYGSRV